MEKSHKKLGKALTAAALVTAAVTLIVSGLNKIHRDSLLLASDMDYSCTQDPMADSNDFEEA